MALSAYQLANQPDNLEIVLWLDEYALNYDLSDMPYVKLIYGPRTGNLSELWNNCAKVATGDIFMHCGDDIVFRTIGWDSIVRNAFAAYPDNIVFVHGDDGFHGQGFGTHGFIHRDWAEAVGYFVPPYFSSDFNDTWLNDVANMIGRRVYVPILTEHMHFMFGKGPKDQTHIERLARGEQDNVVAIYREKTAERQADANKLKAIINKEI